MRARPGDPVPVLDDEDVAPASRHRRHVVAAGAGGRQHLQLQSVAAPRPPALAARCRAANKGVTFVVVLWSEPVAHRLRGGIAIDQG